MKRTVLTFFSAYISFVVFSQSNVDSTGAPAGYYTTATGKSCADLKTTLKTIISAMNPQSYDALLTQYTKTDVKPAESGTGTVIWDIYSDNPNGPDPYSFAPRTDQCGNYNQEGDCYNREHSFPQNWFGGGTNPGPGTDYNHIYPTDGRVNGLRSNYIYGEVANATTTTRNGSKLGSSAVAGLNGPVFEPINEYKGDLARTFLYMVTRYENNIPAWSGISNSEGVQALDNSTFPSVKIAYLKLMLKWHHQDPVSTKEIVRNNGTYSFQGNRNPYIDHPEYADLVWGANCPGLSVLPVDIVYFGGKLLNDQVKLEWVTETETGFDRYEIERSFNGNTFGRIGTVTARGSSNYTFSDNAEAIRGRRVFYRIKKVDKDGNFKYSEVFTLHIPLNTKFTVYPNPARDYIRLQVNGTITGKITLQIADIYGKQLLETTSAIDGSIIKVDTKGLSPGTYILKLTYNGIQYVQKVVVAK